MLVFGFPDLPFSQPRNLVLGHVLSSLVGLICLHLLGPGIWSLALAVSSAIALMMLTRSVHPPAGSNPVIIFLAQPGWGFLLFPTLAGALILLLVALLYNNATRSGRYPRYCEPETTKGDPLGRPSHRAARISSKRFRDCCGRSRHARP